MNEPTWEEQMVRNLLGSDKYTDLLSRMPDVFFTKLERKTREAFWQALLAFINDGNEEIGRLVNYSEIWMELYTEMKKSVKNFKQTFS